MNDNHPAGGLSVELGSGVGATVLPSEIEALFERYAEGFDDFDADAIADCFAFPVTIWQSGRGNVFMDRDELLENIHALLSVFESEEIVHSAFEAKSTALTGEAAFVALAWRQEREDGEAALEFTCRYTLLREPGGDWRLALLVND
ncbi:DUF4440 domain-containing protein [Mangrovibrevibacter kandeliae]|uniref:DUF4440 domain-containing protein n=1 Tax=Mangrovibrevibacter kandeliae TaxID=2968473 RepID=UPI0021175F28|nr:DUF4440 domain-containing protein [Aurantimonas sp. CSK15Z-1]MCQ8782320.1 DUF4440 domain-containing protein [Aurantimonas sp. CSK15Z-1]